MKAHQPVPGRGYQFALEATCAEPGCELRILWRIGTGEWEHHVRRPADGGPCPCLYGPVSLHDGHCCFAGPNVTRDHACGIHDPEIDAWLDLVEKGSLTTTSTT